MSGRFSKESKNLTNFFSRALTGFKETSPRMHSLSPSRKSRTPSPRAVRYEVDLSRHDRETAKGFGDSNRVASHSPPVVRSQSQRSAEQELSPPFLSPRSRPLTHPVEPAILFVPHRLQRGAREGEEWMHDFVEAVSWKITSSALCFLTRNAIILRICFFLAPLML